MKTNKFIEEAESMGFVVKEQFGNVLKICTFIDDSVSIASVWKNKMYAIETAPILFSGLKKEKQEQLFNLLTEYASTPIEERKEEKKYMYRVKEIGCIKLESHKDNRAYLNYNPEYKLWSLNDSEHGSRFKTHFTHSWLKSQGVDIEQLQEVYEEIEVTK